MPVNALTALSRYAGMEARVLTLVRAGVDDIAIARTLTAEGHHSAQHCTAVLPSTVRGIRLQHGLKLVPEPTRWPPMPGWLTVTGIVARLQVPEKWLRRRLRDGAIRTVREPSGALPVPGRREDARGPPATPGAYGQAGRPDARCPSTPGALPCGIEQRVQLRPAQPHHASRRRGPAEPSGLQLLRVQDQAGPVVAQDLHPV